MLISLRSSGSCDAATRRSAQALPRFCCQELFYLCSPEGITGSQTAPLARCAYCTSAPPLSLTASCNMLRRCSWDSAHDSCNHDHRDPQQKPLEELIPPGRPLFHTHNNQEGGQIALSMHHRSHICVSGTVKSFTDVSRNPDRYLVVGDQRCSCQARHPRSDSLRNPPLVARHPACLRCQGSPDIRAFLPDVLSSRLLPMDARACRGAKLFCRESEGVPRFLSLPPRVGGRGLKITTRG